MAYTSQSYHFYICLNGVIALASRICYAYLHLGQALIIASLWFHCGKKGVAVSR